MKIDKQKSAVLVAIFWILFISILVGMANTQVPLRTNEGFLVPQPQAELNFPSDHGNHPEYKIEWWYLTGHLDASTGEAFGYQATFFRFSTTPDSNDEVALSNNQFHLGHMALTDVNGEQFYHEERIQRDGWDAYSRVGKIDIRNGNWILKSDDPSLNPLQLEISILADVKIRLSMQPEKELIQFGEDGTSIKGPHPAARSYYLTYSRLNSQGEVTIGNKSYKVTGSSWMDHEISSMQLDEGFEGWDWTAIQLNDGWEVKAYLLRQPQTPKSEFSALIWISPEGELYYQKASEFEWKNEKTWTSPVSGATYPNHPQITANHPINNDRVTFKLIPRIQHQELTGGTGGAPYWEGACMVYDLNNKEIGKAYLELVGYAEGMNGLR